METQASWAKFVSRSWFLALSMHMTSNIFLIAGLLDSGSWVTINSVIGGAYFGKRMTDSYRGSPH